ncbi:MAG: hypothetical protein WAS33_18145 [Candidatus Promineifilaceae bacterium]|jgi:hypothetical protein|nr:hypothetical protein [Anaerolineaceae bacterium]
MKQRIIWSCLALLLLFSVGLALAGGPLTARDTINAGGGQVSQNGLSLQTAVGQPAVGAVQNGSTLCSGFLCDAEAPETSSGNGNRLYLPFIVR